MTQRPSRAASHGCSLTARVSHATFPPPGLCSCVEAHRQRHRHTAMGAGCAAHRRRVCRGSGSLHRGLFQTRAHPRRRPVRREGVPGKKEKVALDAN